jgi:hypothetical protein
MIINGEDLEVNCGDYFKTISRNFMKKLKKNTKNLRIIYFRAEI